MTTKILWTTALIILILTTSAHGEPEKKGPPLKPPVLVPVNKKSKAPTQSLAQKSFAQLFVETLRRGEFECREVQNPAVCVVTAVMNHMFTLVSRKDKDKVDIASRILEDLAGESVYGENWPKVRETLHKQRQTK